MFNDKQRKIIARINDAVDTLRADESEDAFKALYDTCAECFGDGFVDYNYPWSSPDRDANGDAIADFWIAFEEVGVAGRVVVNIDRGEVEVCGSNDGTSFGRHLVNEALWALEQGVVYGDVDDLARRLGVKMTDDNAIEFLVDGGGSPWVAADGWLHGLHEHDGYRNDVEDRFTDTFDKDTDEVLAGKWSWSEYRRDYPEKCRLDTMEAREDMGAEIIKSVTR